MATDRHELASERHLGSEEGEAFDRCLREAERTEREELLSRPAWGGEDWSEPVLEFPEALPQSAGAAGAAGGKAGAPPRPSHLPLPRFFLPTQPADVARPVRRAPLSALQLQRDLERLTHFYDSVQNSRAWRLTQSLRRLVGRAW